jgi:hypothetical protein
VDKNKMTQLIVRWAARVTGVGCLLLFLVFFIGEGDIRDIVYLQPREVVLILFVPVLFSAGVLVAWWREPQGGILILASVLWFNVTDIVSERKFTGEIEFAFLIIPGLLFLLSWYLDGRRRETHGPGIPPGNGKPRS